MPINAKQIHPAMSAGQVQPPRAKGNTQTVAIIGPIAIGVFKNVGINPIPFVYIIAAAGHCGFMLPSSAGSSAIAAGYGVNLKTMFIKGFWAAVIAMLVIAIGAYLLMTFWPGFGYA